MTGPTSTAPDPGEAFASVRRRRLRERISTVDQAMTVGAAVLLPLGLVLVFLGWYGAAHTPYLFEQLPYLLSGGLLGLGLAMTGGFVLFGGWIARTAREQSVRDDALLEAVRDMREELALLRRAGAEPVPPPPAQRGRRRAAASNGSASRGLVATARGSMLHRPDCAIVTDREDVHDVSEADAQGLRPCRLCNPLASEPAPAHPGRPS